MTRTFILLHPLKIISKCSPEYPEKRGLLIKSFMAHACIQLTSQRCPISCKMT